MDLGSGGSFKQTQHTCILVTGLDADIEDAADLLEEYFSDVGRSWGGPLEGPVKFTDQRGAVVCFSEPTARSRVLSKEVHLIEAGGESVRLEVTTLSQADESSQFTTATAVSVSECGSSDVDYKASFQASLESSTENKSGNTVIVEGFDANDTGDYELKMILEGDDDEDIEIKEIKMDGTSAIVVLGSSDMVDHLIENPPVAEGLKLTVYRPSVPACRSRTVEVTGITRDINEKTLRLFFGKKKRSGGGPIDNICVDYESGVARITFQNQADADEVVKKETHECKEDIVKARYYSSDPATVKTKQSSKETRGGNAPKDTPETRQPAEEVTTVEILAIPPETPKDFLELFFEHPESSGGGRIKNLKLSVGKALITFEKAEVAQRVLAREKLEFGGATLLARIPQATDGEGCSQSDVYHVVEVFGIEGNDVGLIKWVFENKSISGGGPVSDIRPGPHSTTVSFKDPRDAQEVLDKELLKIGDQRWTVKLPQSESADKSDSRTLEVRGIPPNSPEQFVKMFFESSKCNGGDVSKLEYKDEEGVYLVTFKEENTALRVLQHEGLTLGECSLELARHSAIETQGPRKRFQEEHSDASLAPSTTCAIKVKGIDAGITQRRLHMFFENERRSGGGEIEEMDFDAEQRTAVITFKKPIVVERILAKENLSLDQKDIKVVHMKPPAPISANPKEETNPRLLLIKHLSQRSSTENLKDYLEKHGMSEVESVTYGTKPGVVLVTFKTEPDFEALRYACSMKPLRDTMISIQKVEKAKTIQIHKFKAIGREMVELYFESSRESGGDTLEVFDENEEEDYVILEFKKPSVAERVLKQCPHAVEEHRVDVQAFYEGLGVIPPGFNTSRPPTDAPPHIDLPVTPLPILQFWLNSKKTQQVIEDKLATGHCSIEWPTEAESPLRLSCTLDPKSADFQTLAASWKGSAEKAFSSIVEEFECLSIRPPRESWDAFLKKAGLLNTEDKDNMDILLHRDHAEIQLVGRISEVKNKEAEINRTLKDVTDALNREAKSITETISSLSYQQLQLLQAHDATNTMKDMVPQVEFSIGNDGVLLKGTVEDIKDAKLTVLEYIQNPSDCFFNLSPGLKRLLDQTEVKAFVRDEMRRQGSIAVWEACQDGVRLCSRTKKELENAIIVLEDFLCEHQLQVSSKNSTLLYGQEWKQFEENFNQNKYRHVSVLKRGEVKHVSISATKNLFDDAVKQAQQFLTDSAVGDEFIPTTRGMARFLGKHMQKELDEILNSIARGQQTAWEEDEHGIRLDGLSAKIEVLWKRNKHGVHLQGSTTSLNTVSRQVRTMIGKVKEETYPVREKGMEKVFSGTKGENCCNLIESRTEATIDVIQNAPPVEEKKEQVVLPVLKSTVKIENGTLKLVEGDPAAYQADAILIAANEKLQHTDGLARALVAEGGDVIQKVCDDHVRVNGKVLAGNIFASTPGNLPCKMLIHAVCTAWKDGNSGESSYLYDAVYEAIKTAGDSQLQSIAMPVDGAGMFNYPLEEASQTILQAIREYFSEHYPLPQEVHLVNKDNVHELHEAMKAAFGGHIFEASEVESMDIPRGPVRLNRRRPRYAIGAAGGLSVSIVTGLLEEQEVDVIVNTISSDLDLDKGAVSKALLKAGGPSLQTEVKASTSSKKATPGEVLVTSGGGALLCKKVYHGALESWDGSGGEAEKVLRKMLKNCLSKANDNSMTSIALPPLGTGNLMAPSDEVANIFKEELARFDEQNKGSCVKNVIIVMYNKDMPKLQVFEDAFGVSSGMFESRQKPNSPLPVSSDSRRTSGQQKVGGSKRPVQPSDDRVQPIGQSFSAQKIHVGNDVQLLIRHGDITREQTDAIVNCTNEQLDVSSDSVHKAILTAAGDEVKQECKRLGRTTRGIAVTGAGRIPVKNIIHVAPEDHRTATSLQKMVKRALTEADKRRLCSIAFPAMGTAMLDTPPATMASSMFEGLVQFVQKEKHKHLKIIHFTVHDPSMQHTFIETIKNKVEGKDQTWLQQFQSFAGWGGRNLTLRVGQSLPETPKETTQQKRALEESTAKMSLRIYAKSQPNIDKAIEELEDFCRSETKDLLMDKQEEQELIQKLSLEQIYRVENLQQVHCVTINIEKKKKINRIRIQGEIDAAMQAWRDVQNILQEVAQLKKEQEKADIIASQVKWEYADENGKFSTYDPVINMKIENAFRGKQDEIRWTEERQMFRITFQNMVETFGDGADPTEVRRNGVSCQFDVTLKLANEITEILKCSEATALRDGIGQNIIEFYVFDQGSLVVPFLNEVQLPPFWKMSPTDRHKLVQLAPGDQEYDKVMKEFFQTAGGSPTWTIDKIERVQSPDLYFRYETHRKQMNEKYPKQQNERFLWHGTASDSLTNINASGFNRSYCGKNATVYGQGVYFAVESHYSARDQYSPLDSQGHKYMYRARVLTGNYTQGQKGLKEAPEKDPNVPGNRFDSVVDDQTKPRMYIVFTDTQAYPEHLVTFK